MTEKSPYSLHPRRLSDVIAAIQVMSTYKYAHRKDMEWAETLGRNPVSATDWTVVFVEHPEFFRAVEHKGETLSSLVWRRAQARTFDPKLGRHLSIEELGARDKSLELVNGMLTNEPLSSSQTTALIEAAIKLHSAAISFGQDRRWWVAPMAALVGVLLGSLMRGIGL